VTLLERFLEWRRGYDQSDVETLYDKLQVFCYEPNCVVFLTPREYRAIIDGAVVPIGRDGNHLCKML
jgi:hypothetical protein